MNNANPILIILYFFLIIHLNYFNLMIFFKYYIILYYYLVQNYHFNLLFLYLDFLILIPNYLYLKLIFFIY